MTNEEFEDFLAWVEEGKKKGWVSAPICATHEGLPNTKKEENEWEEGDDPCILGMRVWV